MKKFPLKYIALTQLFTSKHRGIDMAWNSKQGGKNVPVYAADDGVVYSTKDNDKSGKSWGNFVKIKHNDGTYTLYAHLKDGIKVKKGQKVKQGDQIGNMGNTGDSKGNHVHYEVYVGGPDTKYRKNPLDYTYVYDGQIVHPDDVKKVKYKPKETTPSIPKTDENDKKIQELQTKVNELTKEVEENNIEINKLKTELEEANSYKLKYIAEVTGIHDIELDKNDILLIK
jgi:hypothetical protein